MVIIIATSSFGKISVLGFRAERAMYEMRARRSLGGPTDRLI